MDAIQFEYGNDQEGYCRTLLSWRESGKYLIGLDATDQRVKTFRKDRVRYYLDGADALLADPHPPTPRAQKSTLDAGPHVLFTGFAKVQRAVLEAKATAAGMRVCKTVTRSCLYLIAGPNAGPTKVEGARELSAFILKEDQFLALLRTGELPDDDDD